MDASKLPKGQSEEFTQGRPVNLPGIYKHEKSGATFITSEGSEGIVQADALLTNPMWKDGWVRVGDVPSRLELLAMRKIQEKKDAVVEAKEKKAYEAELAEAVAKAEAEADARIESEKKEALPVGGETYDPEDSK